MKKYIIGFLLVTCISLSLFLGGCSKEKWDKHYNASTEQNLKDIVNGLRQKGYNGFASAIEKLNLSNTINSGMQLTIFAVPDEAFAQATTNMSDDNLKLLIINHMLAGKFYAASLKDSVYRAIGGSILYIKINQDSISNFYRESVKIATKDIDIPNAVVFELSKCLTIYPDLYSQLQVNYPFFYDLYRSYFVPDVVQYPLILGISPENLQLDSIYKYKKIFTLTQSRNYLTFVVSKNDYAVSAYNQLVSKYLPYFTGGEDVIKSDLTYNTQLKHVIISSAYNKNGDSLIVNNFTGNKLKFPISKVKNQVKLDDGNKLLVIDTLLYNYPLRTVKNISLVKQMASSVSYKGDLNNVTNGIVTWNSIPQPGDYVQCNIPADSIYSKPYDLFLQYGYKNTYAKVKIYIDGDSLSNRVDLGIIQGVRVGSTGSIYQCNIGLDFNIKQYTTHTIRVEVVGTKGSATEIMSLVQLILKLKD